jgi:hypothetical protein
MTDDFTDRGYAYLAIYPKTKARLIRYCKTTDYTPAIIDEAINQLLDSAEIGR